LDALIGASVAKAALNWLNAKCDAWASLSVFVGGVSSQPAMAAASGVEQRRAAASSRYE